MRIPRAFVVAALILVVLAVGLGVLVRLRAAAADTTPGTERIGLVVDGVHRSYLLDLPSADAATGAHPLLVLLHGGGGSAENLDKQTGNLPAMATAARYAVARPDGIGHQWNDGRGVNAGVDDVAFLRAVVEDVGARTVLDRGRVYAAGMSNGAFMSGRLACEPGFPLAGIAQVVGTLGVDADAACDPDDPVSVLAILGADDPIVPYLGGPVRLPWDRSDAGRGVVLGGEAYLGAWITRDATGPAAAGPSIAPDASALLATGPDGTEVELVTVAGGGHGWPGGPQYLPEGLIGHVTDTFSASALMLEFFARHP